MSTKLEIRSQFDLVSELTHLFCEELKEVGFHKASYYQLPDIDINDEKKVPSSISVQKIEGDDAHKLILNSFGDFYKKWFGTFYGFLKLDYIDEHYSGRTCYSLFVFYIYIYCILH